MQCNIAKNFFTLYHQNSLLLTFKKSRRSLLEIINRRKNYKLIFFSVLRFLLTNRPNTRIKSNQNKTKHKKVKDDGTCLFKQYELSGVIWLD